MAKKKKEVDLNELSREELIKKIQNQKESNAALNEKVKSLTRENELLRETFSTNTVSQRVRYATEESLSLMEDIEHLKQILIKHNIKEC